MLRLRSLGDWARHYDQAALGQLELVFSNGSK